LFYIIFLRRGRAQVQGLQPGTGKACRGRANSDPPQARFEPLAQRASVCARRAGPVEAAGGERTWPGGATLSARRSPLEIAHDAEQAKRRNRRQDLGPKALLHRGLPAERVPIGVEYSATERPFAEQPGGRLPTLQDGQIDVARARAYGAIHLHLGLLLPLEHLQEPPVSGQGEEVLFAECRTLSDAALNVAEVAGAAGMDALGEVARGISAMVESLTTSGVWHSDALKLHLDALALINQAGGRMTEENKVILARLRGMRATVGVTE